MGSARTVTGVGPRNVFMFTGTSGTMVTNNLLGGVTASYSGSGVYGITHNIGNTAYCCQFSVEATGGDDIYCYVVNRAINGVECQVVNTSGAAFNPQYIHGTIHDGGG